MVLKDTQDFTERQVGGKFHCKKKEHYMESHGKINMIIYSENVFLPFLHIATIQFAYFKLQIKNSDYILFFILTVFNESCIEP